MAIIKLILITIFIITIPSISIFGQVDTSYYGMTKEKHKLAKKVVKEWMRENADSLEKKRPNRLGRLRFHPDESALDIIELIEDEYEPLSDSKKDSLRKELIKYSVYAFVTKYRYRDTTINKVKKKKMYISLNPNLKITIVEVYEGNRGFPKIVYYWRGGKWF